MGAHAAQRVIVDEDTGQSSALWRKFHREFAEADLSYVFLKDSHVGIPDVEILDKLLDHDTVLLTGDRVLHMRALEAGYRSYTLNEHGQLTRRRLTGIRPLKRVPESVHTSLQASYRYQPTNVILGQRIKSQLTEKQFQRYRTARRRIRSHFGSAKAIARISVTVGARSTTRGLLSGFVFRLAGNSGVKGLHARDGFCVPEDQGNDPAYTLIFAIRDLFLLQLDQTPIDLFVIPPPSLELARNLTAETHSADQGSMPNGHRAALLQLLEGLDRVELHPCCKGTFFERMELRLEQLSLSASNEITTFDFDALAKSLGSEQAQFGW